jgi:hypothetical protein
MSTPTNHSLAIAIAEHKIMHARVLSLKNLLSKGRPGVASDATVEIEMSEALPMGEYIATYCTYGRKTPGTFNVQSFSSTKDLRYRATGVFTRDQQQRW